MFCITNNEPMPGIQDEMMYEFIYSVFAGIGFGIVLYYAMRIFFELMYILIFTIGYFVLHLLNYNWKKVKAKPFMACIATLKIIRDGFLHSFDCPTELTLGLWTWRPLFKLTKI